jgi:hypothetical protein
LKDATMSTKWHIWFDAHENTKTVGGDDVQDGFFGMLEKSDFWFRSAELPCTFSTQKVTLCKRKSDHLCMAMFYRSSCGS